MSLFDVTSLSAWVGLLVLVVTALNSLSIGIVNALRPRRCQPSSSSAGAGCESAWGLVSFTFWRSGWACRGSHE